MRDLFYVPSPVADIAATENIAATVSHCASKINVSTKLENPLSLL
jgi:hypothetical protein